MPIDPPNEALAGYGVVMYDPSTPAPLAVFGPFQSRKDAEQQAADPAALAPNSAGRSFEVVELARPVGAGIASVRAANVLRNRSDELVRALTQASFEYWNPLVDWTEMRDATATDPLSDMVSSQRDHAETLMRTLVKHLETL